MAAGKKTFIFYSDWINMVRQMADSDAGELLKHILSYVNDENPTTENPFVRMAFGHIMPMLKNDLKKWDKQLEKYREMGKKSAAARKKQPRLTQVEPKSTNVQPRSTVNDNVNVLLEKETKELLDRWINYRRDIKKPIKSELTLNTLSEKISQEGFEKSKWVINDSISNGYQGLFWKNYKAEKQKPELDAMGHPRIAPPYQKSKMSF